MARPLELANNSNLDYDDEAAALTLREMAAALWCNFNTKLAGSKWFGLLAAGTMNEHRYSPFILWLLNKTCILYHLLCCILECILLEYSLGPPKHFVLSLPYDTRSILFLNFSLVR